MTFDTVVFACVHNAGRSQMAAARFDLLADPAKARAVSAGTEPGERVHPEVVQVMREEGLDLSSRTPRLLTDDLASSASMLVTTGSSFFGGAAFLVACDAIARVVLPGRELPVGVITAALGAPTLVFLVSRARRD